MRRALMGAFAVALLAATHADATEISRDPDLVIAFVNSIADICLPMVHGAKLTADSAARMDLQPLPAEAAIRARFPKIPDWFTSKTFPDSLYVGAGDKPSNCHLILANTTLTKEAQTRVRALLLATGHVESPSHGQGMNETMFARQEHESLLAIVLQGPYDTVQGGKDDQANLHVGLIPMSALKTH